MKVVKFGGSSLASSQQLYKVLNIIKSDYTRRFVVVSAPGKRYEEDLKMTDALIQYYQNYINGKDIVKDQTWIINRYQEIISDLSLGSTIAEEITRSIEQLASLPIENNQFLYDCFLAAGEDNNAKLVATFLIKMTFLQDMFIQTKQELL
ncbi:aspartate kinase [Streptococcus agalactiae]|nr:aspartate kinase [Streptococcus agalactiae]